MIEDIKCDHGDLSSDQNCLMLVPIFNHLDSKDLKEILLLIKSGKFQKGEVLYRPFEPANTLYIIRSGKIKLYRLSENAKEQVIRMLGPGDFTGELNLFADKKHESYAEVLVDAEVCMIDKEEFKHLLNEHPAITYHFLESLSTRLSETEQQMTWIGIENVESRVASYLISLHNQNSSSNLVRIPMTKKDLASLLGTTPETLSRRLASLEQQNLIKLVSNRTIRIVDFDKLNRI